MPRMTIDGNEVEADGGMSVLQAVRSKGIKIPTLCYHDALKPIGACKLCGVEVRGRTGKPRVLLSCILRVKEGLKVTTESDLVKTARQSAFRNLLVMAPSPGSFDIWQKNMAWIRGLWLTAASDVASASASAKKSLKPGRSRWKRGMA